MSTPLLIGLTGGIGSGKSLVAKIFSSLNIPVYDADSRAKILMTSDPVLIDGIKKEFGAMAYREDGTLNRDFLATVVFKDELILKKLNQLVHPRVQMDTEKWVKENSNQKYLIKEAALLFESGSNQFLDKIIVVTAPEKLRTKRVLARDKHRSETEIANIMQNQLSEDEKVKRADFVIKNDETELLIPQILKLHERFNGLIKM